MWCNTFGLKQGCGAIHLGLNMGVVQYLWAYTRCGAILFKQGCRYFWLKQGCGAILLDCKKGVLQYFWT